LTERAREGVYWKVCLLFLLASPLVFYVMRGRPYSPSFHPFPFTIILVASLPLAFLTDVVLTTLFGKGAPLRFWVVRPSEEVRHLLPAPMEGGGASNAGLPEETYLAQVVERIRGRLTLHGFGSAVLEEPDGSAAITFNKVKTDPVMAFMDNAIFGEARVRPSDSAVEVRVRVTFDDTLIVETGEFEQMRSLCHYLSLKLAKLDYKTVPHVLTCGLTLAFATTVVALVPSLYRAAGPQVFTCLSLGGVGMIVCSLFVMRWDREHLIGYRLAYAGLYLSSLPLLYKLWEALRP
jgi:hypothetical protein